MKEYPKELINKFNEVLETINFETTTPRKEDVLRFFEIKPENIKVVIIGQDPYPTEGVANGRAFAVNKNCKIPQSLKNIFKEIEEVQGFIKTDETLQHWANQGVLMLNTYLTTTIGQPNAHKDIWKALTKKLIIWIDENIKPTFVLWGNEAFALSKVINHSKIIYDAHPSPLSVRHRNKNTFKEIKGIEW